MIAIKKLNKKFGKVEVLKDLSLDIDEGGIFAILGPNGSGKTTLIKSILGLVIPNSGDIAINSKAVKGEWEYRKDINYLPQIANFPENLTVFEIIEMIKNIRSKSTNDRELIDAFGLNDFLHRKLSNLSGGTRQKVNIVLTFMFNSNLIILDEPTTGLDPISLVTLKELIRKEQEEGKTILITSHIMSFVEEVAEKIVFLLEGNIYFKGSVEEIMKETNQKSLELSIAHLLKNHNA
jgi:Cu-processing system ATP-binding protein